VSFGDFFILLHEMWGIADKPKLAPSVQEIALFLPSLLCSLFSVIL